VVENRCFLTAWPAEIDASYRSAHENDSLARLRNHVWIRSISFWIIFSLLSFHLVVRTVWNWSFVDDIASGYIRRTVLYRCLAPRSHKTLSTEMPSC
jgi:hypothetical protein